MITASSENKDIQYAYRSIHEFFDNYDFYSAVKETNRIIKAAASEKAWLTRRPYQPVYFMEVMQPLIAAAFVLEKHAGRRASCIILSETGIPDLAQTQNYVGRHRYSNAWNCMPRHLNAAQFHDPYLAIRKFTARQTEGEWKQVCKDLGEYALSNSSVIDEYLLPEILAIRLHLLRLIEACHLLQVRSNDPRPAPPQNQ
jgi:hypothetical protein